MNTKFLGYWLVLLLSLAQPVITLIAVQGYYVQATENEDNLAADLINFHLGNGHSSEIRHPLRCLIR
jgi:hypothetical protein